MESQCIREEDGRLLRNDDIIVHKRWARFVHSLLNEKTGKLDAVITFKLPQQTTMAKLGKGGNITNGGKGSNSAPRDGKLVSSGNGRISCGTAETRAELGPVDPAGVPPPNRLITTVWRKNKVLQRRKDVTIMAIHKKIDKEECGDHRSISP